MLMNGNNNKLGIIYLNKTGNIIYNFDGIQKFLWKLLTILHDLNIFWKYLFIG